MSGPKPDVEAPMSTLTLPPVAHPSAPRPLASRTSRASAQAPVPGGVEGASSGRHARASCPVRLTRRGRLVARWLLVLATIGLVLTAVVGAVLLGGGSAQGGEHAAPVPVSYHLVAPGETLWQIALRAEPGSDPRDLVEQIVELNHLSSAELPVGLRLAVPRR